MTANELADWLDKKAIVSFTEYFGEHLELAANLLRQQQAEIEALHKLVKEQDMKIINLSFDVAYANRTDEFRELTDEQMLEVYKKVFNKQNEFKENLKRRSYFDFARAILKKAREHE
jgi:hypothetical protein